MNKSIVQKVKYISRKQISYDDKDQIEEVTYLNVFKFNKVLYGWKEYDMRIGKPLKSDNWKLGSYMDLQFIPKDYYNAYNGQLVKIIQRPKVVKSETQLLIEKTQKVNIKSWEIKQGLAILNGKNN